MADEQNDASAQPQPKSRGRVAVIVTIVMIMGLEGVGVFFVARALNPAPQAALGVEQGEGDPQDANTEIEVADCRPSNMVSGKFVTFHLRVSALVLTQDSERVEKMIRSKQARLEQGVNTVIRRAQPDHLTEPDLGTLRRRLKHEFNRVLGEEGLVKEVIFRQFLQSGPGV